MLLIVTVQWSPALADGTTITEYATVMNDAVNIREGYSTDTPVLTVAHAGEEFRVILKRSVRDADADAVTRAC